MTFLLVAVVYAVAIGKPSFTETGPLAVGFSLWASAFVGEFAVHLPQHLITLEIMMMTLYYQCIIPIIVSRWVLQKL